MVRTPPLLPSPPFTSDAAPSSPIHFGATQARIAEYVTRTLELLKVERDAELEATQLALDVGKGVGRGGAVDGDGRGEGGGDGDGEEGEAGEGQAGIDMEEVNEELSNVLRRLTAVSSSTGAE